jgi:hypothetical protein
MPGLARRKVSFPYKVAREPNCNILSERMAYYSRYATGKKGVMLGFSMLQLVTSKPKAVAPSTQPFLCFVVFRRIQAAVADSHVPFAFSYLIVCMAFLTMHKNPSLLRSFYHRKMFPLDLMSEASYLLAWLV